MSLPSGRILSMGPTKNLVIWQPARKFSRHKISHISVLGHETIGSQQFVPIFEESIPSQQLSHCLLLANGCVKIIFSLFDVGKSCRLESWQPVFRRCRPQGGLLVEVVAIIGIDSCLAAEHSRHRSFIQPEKASDTGHRVDLVLFRPKPLGKLVQLSLQPLSIEGVRFWSG